MGRVLMVFVMSQISAHGWWYCSTMQAGIGDTPLVIVPAVSSAVLVLMGFVFVFETWDI